MSDSINLSIPFATFGAVPFEECEAALLDADLHKPRYCIVLYRIFGFLDWTQTIRIGEHDFMTAWTCVFSEAALAAKIGACVRVIGPVLRELCQAGILRREKVGKCFRYHIALFDKAIAFLKANPPETVRIEYLKSKPAAVKHTSRQNKSAKTSDSQDSLKEKPSSPTGLGTSTGIAQSTPKGEEGKELKTSQKQKPSDVTANRDNDTDFFLNPPPPESTERPQQEHTQPTDDRRSKGSCSAAAPAAAPTDVVPNSYIGAAVDKLSEKHQATRSRSEVEQNETEQFLLAFNPKRTAVVVTDQEYAEVRQLTASLEATLEAANVQMPLLEFFKRCLKELEGRVARNEADPAKTLKYFTETHWGKEIVVFCADQRKSEAAVFNDVARTKKRINALKDRPTPNAEQQASVSDMIANAFTPEAIAKAKAVRKERT